MFLTAFLLLYLFVHYYVFSRLYQLFHLKKKWTFYLIILLLASSFILASIFDHWLDGPFFRIFYILSAIWVATVFIAFWVLLIQQITSKFWKHDSKTAGYVVIGFVAVIILYGGINTFIFKVNEITVPIENLEQEIKIVQLSDIHLGTILQQHYLRTVVDKVNELNPDVILFTGDLFDGSRKLTDEDLKPLNDLKAPVYFVTGNPDVYYGLDLMTEQLNKTKVKILRNQVENFSGVQIIGVDNPPEGQELGEVDGSPLSKISWDANKPTILMYHMPSNLEEASARGIDLQLSGHTHYGQIFPFTLLSMLFFPHNAGLYEMGNTTLYVSQGIGTWGPPIRIGTRSELVVIHLVKK